MQPARRKNVVPTLQARKLEVSDVMERLSINRAKELTQRLAGYPGFDSQVSPLVHGCSGFRISVMSKCPGTSYEILGVLLYSFLKWLLYYKNQTMSYPDWCSRETLTVTVFKQRKNSVLFSRTVMALTHANEYFISKQNPNIQFIFQGTKIWRGNLFEQVSCSSFAGEY